MSVTKKMLLLILAALLGVAGLAGLGIKEMNQVYSAADYGNVNSVPSVLLMGKNIEQFNRLRVRMYRSLLVEDPARLSELDERIRDARSKFLDGLKEYERLISDDTDRRLLEEERSHFAEYDRRTSEALAMVRNRHRAEGIEAFLAATTVADKVNTTLSEHLDYNEKLSRKGSEAAATTKDGAFNLLLGVGVLTVLAVALLGAYITRSLLRSLGGEPATAVEVARRVAQGDLSTEIHLAPGDSTSLMAALKAMTDSLQGLIDEMNRMSREHDQGDIDVVIDSGRFQGSYKTMAEGVNRMVAGHIAVKKKAMACVKAFGEGDFDAPLETFPGKKRFINDTVEQLRSNVKDFIAQMHRMSSEHDQGDIDVVIDSGRFQGSYKTMAEGVNAMVGGHIAVKKKAMACVKAFGEGDFDAPLETFPG
ncbi:MAG TPA: MCP four helix bundle domain-containing protein, partial [Burkholderiaceae bacterium]|nr:MCP four helix bundle domain-containing protein [Burkholderiaceae bacterium]